MLQTHATRISLDQRRETGAERFPSSRSCSPGAAEQQYSFSLDNLPEAGKIFQGMPPSKDGTTLTACEQMPAGVPLTIEVECPEQFSPGLDPELIALIQETPKT